MTYENPMSGEFNHMLSLALRVRTTFLALALIGGLVALAVYTEGGPTWVWAPAAIVGAFSAALFAWLHQQYRRTANLYDRF